MEKGGFECDMSYMLAIYSMGDKRGVSSVGHNNVNSIDILVLKYCSIDLMILETNSVGELLAKWI